jgi:hypothetical protein
MWSDAGLEGRKRGRAWLAALAPSTPGYTVPTPPGAVPRSHPPLLLTRHGLDDLQPTWQPALSRLAPG